MWGINRRSFCFLLWAQTKLLLMLPVVSAVVPAQGPSEWVRECWLKVVLFIYFLVGRGHLGLCLFRHVPLSAKCIQYWLGDRAQVPGKRAVDSDLGPTSPS